MLGAKTRLEVRRFDLSLRTATAGIQGTDFWAMTDAVHDGRAGQAPARSSSMASPKLKKR